MPEYVVIGTDASGKTRRAKVEARDEQHARERATRHGLTVERVEASAERAAVSDDGAIVRAASQPLARPEPRREVTQVAARTVIVDPPAMRSAVVKWAATGIWKDDGQAGTIDVMAATQREAEMIAASRGLLVELVIPASMVNPATAPPAAAPATPPAAPQVIYMQAPAAPISNVINVTTHANNNSGNHDQDRAPSFSAGTAAVLSFFIPGLGQMYKGQLINGVAWFLIVLTGYAFLILPGLILHVFCVLGAASQPRR